MTESPSMDVLSQVRQYDLGNADPPKAPSVSLKKADVESNLIGAQKVGRMTGFTIEGVTAGSDAELFIKYYVIMASVQERWGRECHWVLPIGPPDASSTPVGRIIMRWTADGHCTATLIGDQPIGIKQIGTMQELIGALQTKRKMGKVTGRDGVEWEENELRKVVVALNCVPKEDWEVLAGVDVVRVSQVDPKEPETNAQFRLSQRFDRDHLAIIDVAELVVDGGAFADDDKVFIGSDPNQRILPLSCQKIVHEVGHMVELAARRRKYAARMAADLEATRALNEVTQAGAKATPDQKTRSQQARAQYDQAVAEVEATKAPGTNDPIPVQALVTFVVDHNINRRLTRYAGDNWANIPAEFYADAYSLWVLDRQFLTGFSTDLVSFFDAGTYRSLR
jgi:hypothetical protein